MQYILSEAEYQEILELRSRKLSISHAKLGSLCTKIADTMPVTWTWGPGKETPRPWGCIKTHDDWYCDQCPVSSICPLDKTYSS